MWQILKRASNNGILGALGNASLALSTFLIFYLSWNRSNYLYFQLENFHYNLVLYIFYIFYFFLLSYTLVCLVNIKNNKINFFLSGLSLLLLFLSPPLLSLDIGAYIFGAKNLISSHSHVYIDALRSASPWVEEMKAAWWLDYPTIYGPVFLLITLPSLVFSSLGFTAVIFSYKFIVLLAFLFLLYIFWLLTRAEEEGVKKFWLLALNPALLINWVLEGHNDIFIALGLLGFIYYLVRRKNWPAWFVFILTIFIKYTTLIFAPILFIKERAINFKKVFIFFALTLLLFFIFFKASGLTLAIFSGNLFFLNHCFFKCSPVVNFFSFFGPSQFFVRSILFLVLYIFLVWKYLYKKTDYLKFIFWSGLSLFFVQTTWLTPWYPTIIIPFGLLLKEKKYYYLVILITWYCLLHYIFL